MRSDGSVTHWFEQIRDGDSIAAEAIGRRYFPEQEVKNGPHTYAPHRMLRSRAVWLVLLFVYSLLKW